MIHRFTLFIFSNFYWQCKLYHFQRVFYQLVLRSNH